MKRYSLTVVALLVFACFGFGCGGSGGSDSNSLEQYLPAGLAERGLRKVSEPRTYVGDSLWEYINGGAELYHGFGFVKVTTTDYKSPQTEIVLDLYQFDSPEGAYGLYAALRPDEPDLVAYGVEGYFTGTSLEFVKGDIMVRMISYDDNEATGVALKAMAAKLSTDLPGTVDPPVTFGLFPQEGAVPGTDKIIGEAFLGQAFLNMVYTRDFVLNEERVTLFMMDETLGDGFARWFDQVTEAERSPATLVDLPYHESYYLLTTNDYYGSILAGLKNEKLVGVINFSDQLAPFVTDWLNSLPSAP